MLKKIDKITLDLTTALISVISILNVLTKYNIPEVNIAFWGVNPFALKKDIIDSTMTWIFSLLALIGLSIQLFKILPNIKIPKRLYKTQYYYSFLVIGVLLSWFVVMPIFRSLGHGIAKQIWMPKIVETQKEAFEKTVFIFNHHGWRKDQLKIKDSLDNPEEYINANLQQIDGYISQMEKLFDIKKLPRTRKEKIENLEKYFK